MKISNGRHAFSAAPCGAGHAPDDMVMFVQEDSVLYAGDLIFIGRVPFVGDADSRSWLVAIDKVIGFKPKFMITGHGEASSKPIKTSNLPEVICFTAQGDGKAVEEFVPFAEAYANTDWSAYSHLPAFDEGNRGNAYNTYLLMEKESMK